ncbi:periodic tryptophan protein 1, putative, partial [Hepatocystis sp. ex Piliocolobus tephrosceles]
FILFHFSYSGNEMSFDEDDNKKDKDALLNEQNDDLIDCIFTEITSNREVIKKDDIIKSNNKYMFEDELRIEKDDTLVFTGMIYSDIGTLEVHIFNYDENIFCIYDDVVIDSYPLCMEVINSTQYENKNIVAIGTMNKEIGLWDIDHIDSLEPLCYLGKEKKKKKKKKKKSSKKKKKKMKLEHELYNNDATTNDDDKQKCINKDNKNNLCGHSKSVTCLATSKHIPNLLCSGSKDCLIKLWDLSKHNVLHTFNCHSKKIKNLSFHETNKNIFFSTSSDKSLKIFDIRKNKFAYNISSKKQIEAAVWCKQNEHMIYTSSANGYIHQIDTRYIQSSDYFFENNTIKFKAFDSACTSLLSTHYNNLIVAGSEEGLVKAYDISTFTENHDPDCVHKRNFK